MLPNILIKKRILFLLFLCTTVIFALILRLFWIQVIKSETYQKMALPQWTLDVLVSPKRGIIFDRNGKTLAESASSNKISIVPKDIKDSEREFVALKLAKLLNIKEEDILKKISNHGVQEVLIARRVNDDIINEIRKLNIPGIIISVDTKRYYPDKNLASHILGFTGADNQGLDGIESVFDNYLRGIPGRISFPMDAIGRKMEYGTDQYYAPVNGYNVILTLDETIQHFTEKALDDGIAHAKPTKGAVAIVMDPKTGEILAMASRPDYDPNNPFAGSKEDLYKKWRNKAVSDAYEPGSVFKTVTASAALEENAVSPDDQFYCPGYITVAGQRINCWSTHGSETFVKGVQNSCNVVFATVAQRLGVDKLYKYIHVFGFGQKTDIVLPGEAPGLIMKEKNVGPVELATNAFGQGIAVTPLQMIRAVSAIVNGGKLMEPHIVKAIVDDKGNPVKEFKPKIVRKVISEKTSATMRSILESVVSEGTGKAGYIEGYDVGGKTGTTEKYAPGKYVASYIGFAPADDPKIIVLIVIDEPNAETHFGSALAGPVAKSILQDSLTYLEVKPKGIEKKPLVVVPDIKNMKVSDAQNTLMNGKLRCTLQGNGNVVVDQIPKAGAMVEENTLIVLYLNNYESNQKVEVPDLKGKTVVEASNILNDIGLKIKINGSGVSVSQKPEKGELVDKGTTVSVDFRPLEN
ncbi:stage V sporulation protein D [Aceticella autotrophica]|uniref:Stage V sporulation protein D n=1 Tax=Aceticella autotrophica TaxID=2755338 RepID=A0A975AXL0_9THEO|nr:stage V sporulation protein D [Aceticella autotrophica]QSZ28322.1 stage V sporulation protein D [Aceticella autotrophica]